jgi:predicted ATPase
LQRSANAEAVRQLERALNQIAAVPATPALRRDEIKFQVALANALMHTKGYAAPETETAFDKARVLIETAEALGERPENPLILFSILYGMWAANFVAFKGHALRQLSAQFLALARKQTSTAPIMIGHRLVATSLTFTGNLIEGRDHYDQALAIYDRNEHLPLATQFGQDVGVVILSFRSWDLWLLGYPEAARTDIETALGNARDLRHAPTLMYALFSAVGMQIYFGNYSRATELAGELLSLAEEKDAVLWKAASLMFCGCVSVLTGDPKRAVDQLSSGFKQWRSTGATLWTPLYLPHLATAHALVGQLDSAWQRIEEATTAATKESWWEAEVNRVAGQISLCAAEPDVVRAERHFGRALAVARQQNAKSWELRAAMSMARLWRNQGKRNEARELLAPVYGWFTEGFDTRDHKEARTLLDELA